jgi:hypothetical protein
MAILQVLHCERMLAELYTNLHDASRNRLDSSELQPVKATGFCVESKDLFQGSCLRRNLGRRDHPEAVRGDCF